MSFGSCCLQTVDELAVVVFEFVAEVRPIARVGIVQPEMYDRDISTEFQGFAVFFLFVVGTVSVSEECGSAFSEIPDFIVVAEHPLQLCRIGQAVAPFDAVAEGDAVADACHFDASVCHGVCHCHAE